jgi:hypothetical protein
VVLTQSFKGEEDWLTTGDPLRWLQANIAVALKKSDFHDDLIKFIKTLSQ